MSATDEYVARLCVCCLQRGGIEASWWDAQYVQKVAHQNLGRVYTWVPVMKEGVWEDKPAALSINPRMWWRARSQVEVDRGRRMRVGGGEGDGEVDDGAKARGGRIGHEHCTFPHKGRMRGWKEVRSTGRLVTKTLELESYIVLGVQEWPPGGRGGRTRRPAAFLPGIKRSHGGFRGRKTCRRTVLGNAAGGAMACPSTLLSICVLPIGIRQALLL